MKKLPSSLRSSALILHLPSVVVGDHSTTIEAYHKASRLGQWAHDVPCTIRTLWVSGSVPLSSVLHSNEHFFAFCALYHRLTMLLFDFY